MTVQSGSSAQGAAGDVILSAGGSQSTTAGSGVAGAVSMTGGSAVGSNAGGSVAIVGDIGAAAGGSVRVLSGHGTSNASGDVPVGSSSSGGQSVSGAVRVESGKTWWFIHLEEWCCIHV